MASIRATKKIYLLGEAPSSDSKDSLLSDSSIEPFPRHTKSGKAVHGFVDKLPVILGNASPVYLGQDINGKEKRPHRYDSCDTLRELVEENAEPNSIRVVLASVQTWVPAIMHAEGSSWAVLHQNGILGGPIQLKLGDTEVGKAIIVPHPAKWKHRKPRELRESYRQRLLDWMENHEHPKGAEPPVQPWKSWIDESLREFGL